MVLFELIQVAIGRRIEMSCILSEEGWEQIFKESQRQAVVGIALYGIQMLPREQWPPRTLLFEWIGLAEAIRATNEQVSKRCCKLQTLFSEAGIRSSILKGQAIAGYYGDSLTQYRQPGDIDIYVDCGLEGALKFAKERGLKYVDWDYKHLHLDIFKGTEVEMHYRVEVLLNIRKNRMLQKWFMEHHDEIFNDNEGLNTNQTNGTNKIVTPTTDFNRFYILLHIYRHFLYEGVGLRQLMDYYFVLLAEDAKNSFDLQKDLKKYGMWRFAQGIMWVMNEVFGLERKYMYCEPLENEGKFILEEIIEGGNFGHYDERKATKRRGKIFTVVNIINHNAHLIGHYPADVLWSPVWFMWHKLWKVRMKRQLKAMVKKY